MLLNFKCENFKSFQEGFTFQMEPESRMTELRYSILTETIAKKEEKALSASVIYGPNAAGKTSIVNAMSCLRQIILKGNIDDSEDDRTGDHVSASMNLIPFGFSEEAEPVSFDISFTWQEVKYHYAIAFMVGKFLTKGNGRYITREQLYINDIEIFHRTENGVTKLSLASIKEHLNVGYNMTDAEKHRAAMSNNLSPTSLLLVTDFYSFCSKLLVTDMKEWFTKQFVVINSSDRKRFYPNVADMEGNVVIDVYINEIAKEAGIVGSDFAYLSDADSHLPKLVSVLNKQSGKLFALDAEQIESVGTMRLISIMPVVLSSLRNGSVLIMDELDASLHPMIVMNLITLFHNDEVNKKNAQLIFNTHNPIYLNNRLLRRDEIKFVERDKATKSSSLYALSDFKTNGDASVRKTSDYMKNYFVNRYGAIEDIDFTDIVLEMLSKEGDSENGER
jgi:AAA15 family ATPase/GTPase